MKIGVFDSGIGGTTVLKEIKKLLPNEEYYYIADSKNCPYGEKTDKELFPIVKNNVDTLKKWGARIIVIACNTATTRCIKMLRETYPELIFVGTEPAIKLAAQTGKKNILVLATPGTLQSEQTAKLLNENQQPNQIINLLPCPGLADCIETNLGKNETLIDNKLDELLSEQKNNYDVIVLGCTHYPLIKAKIQKKFPTALLIDGGEGVAKQVKRLISS